MRKFIFLFLLSTGVCFAAPFGPTKPPGGIDATTVVPNALSNGVSVTLQQMAQTANGAVQQSAVNQPNGVAGLNNSGNVTAPINSPSANFSGNVTAAQATFPTVTALILNVGSPTLPGSKILQFHTLNSTASYDAAIITTGGSATAGTGDMSVNSGTLFITGQTTVSKPLYTTSGISGNGTGPNAWPNMDHTGGYSLAWNADGTSRGETDFININAGVSGGFSWYNTLVANWTTSKPPPVMTLSGTGLLQTASGYLLTPMTKAAILSLSSQKEGQMLNDSTDHVPVIYENGHWYPLQLGTALSN